VDPLLSALGLGFVLGLQHATDADHLVAVATIVSRERRVASGAAIGAFWGVGHTATLGAAGLAMVGLGLTLPERVTSGLELLVAAMLIALGAWRLHDVVVALRAAPPAHLLAEHVADHEHGGRGGFIHSHVHDHRGHPHDHAHVHPPARLAAALRPGRRRGLRPLLVGAVHGLAGSAAVSLLVLSTVRSMGEAVLFLALFGVGTIVGMLALTAVMACPVALALRVERARLGLATAAGLGSIAFGLVYAWSV
jgi:high-affinity nickel-transport protein